MKEKAAQDMQMPQFEFRNKKFRQLCVGVMFASFAIAAIYLLMCFVNINHTTNLPRLVCRIGFTVLFAVETALFAHRNSVYMEIGGDFALARRSGSAMLILMILSSIVESYYVSAVAVPDGGTLRLVYMAAIIFVGCASLLPLVEFQYLNLSFFPMRLLVLVGMAASIVAFGIGFFMVGVNEMVIYNATGFKQIVSRIFDSSNPVYLINCLNGIVILVIAHIDFVKEQRKDSKFLPKSAKDPFYAPTPVDDDPEADTEIEEYLGL